MPPATSKSAPIRRSGAAGIAQLLLIVVLAVVIIGGVGIWYFVFRETAPDKTNIDAASKSVKDLPSNASSDVAGTWSVDTSIGSFDAEAEDYSSAWVGYRVREELAGIGAKTAFGRTPDVQGFLTIEGTTVTVVDIEADLTTLQSDDSRRDGQLGHQGIETDQFPTATFKLTEPIELGDITEGETIQVDGVGVLELHGVTQSVTVPLEAVLENGTIAVTGSIPIVFADYDIEPPTAGIVLSIEDNGEMELQLFFTKD
ncbi:MAG: YceI family protein [Actinobacteria bacterium]|nr:YceI family protein [Actinomycetota bacterium]